MGAFLVVGLPGSGKTTLRTELINRGMFAIDADEDEELSGFRSRKGEPLCRRLTDEQASTGVYRWMWRKKRIKNLVHQASEQPAFICGNAANAAKFYERFNKVFALIVSDDQLSSQLAQRPDAFGSLEADRLRIVSWNTSYRNNQAQLGAVLIDASFSPPEVVDTILELCHEVK